MNKCPFCKKEIKLEEILFFASRESGGHTGHSVREKQRDDEDFSTSKKTRRGMKSAAVEPAEIEEDVQQTEAAQQEAESFIGKWAVDEINKNYLADFLNAGEIKDKNRFIVHWSDKEAVRGVGKAILYGNNKLLPTAVELCEEDAAIAGARRLTLAMCPHCHCPIPAKYMETPEENCHAIRLIGYPASGKTQYKLAVREEMIRNLSVRYQLCQQVEMFGASDDFLINEEENFKDGKAESTAKDQVVFPMVFAIRKKNNVSHLVTIYDLPGEAFRPGNGGVLVDNQANGDADAALLMVDAAQLYDNVRNEKILVVSKDGEHNEEFDSVEENVTILEPLKNLEEFDFGKNVEYLALVVTKADLLLGKFGNCFGENNPVTLKQLRICQSDEFNDHKKSVRAQVMNQVDMETMRAIRETEIYADHEDLKQEICDYLGDTKLKKENIRAFTVSTLRRPNSMNTDFVVCDDSGYTRHRILEPILYLLARWNVVDCEGGDNWGAGSNGDAPIQEGQSPKKDEEKKRGFFGRLFGH